MSHRYDRDGERLDDDEQPQTDDTSHPTTCQAGWLGTNDDGALVPCPVCRAGTIARLKAQRERCSK
jgi:hypothetical protein